MYSLLLNEINQSHIEFGIYRIALGLDVRPVIWNITIITVKLGFIAVSKCEGSLGLFFDTAER